jgi:glycosyltransferase involved in cell wall biosynthesis
VEYEPDRPIQSSAPTFESIGRFRAFYYGQALLELAYAGGNADCGMLNRVRHWASGVGLSGRARGRPTCFDVSDLLLHFRNARVPTGIQRVQIEVIIALLQVDRSAIQICAFSEQRGCWVRVPKRVFARLCDLSLAGGNSSTTVWRASLRLLTWRIRFALPMRFAPGAALVNLGTSWWLSNYFASVGDAKAKYGIHYVALLYDLIPFVAPQYCIPGLTQDFIRWISDVFDQADSFLVISQSTRADLLSAAGKLGRCVLPDAVTVVPLDADFAKTRAAKRKPEGLDARGLHAGKYVLFVSTIESRKNHIGAFSAWLALTGKHGAAAIPKLVCVGNAGWLNAEVHAKLEASEILQSRVTMLSGVSDDELAQLYDNCLFTFYPSHYEGWGLPVTESLCHGKVPLIPAVSSLPEAGGPFADYFEADSPDSMVAGLERLIFDDAHRAAQEKYIREAFRPRSWLEIGKQIEQSVANL